MSSYPQKYKRIDDPNVARFFTFGTYKRKALFDDIYLCKTFLNILSEYSQTVPLEIWAYVIMPNHLHLILYAEENVSLRKQIAHIKRKFSHYAIKYFHKNRPNLLNELTAIDHGEKVVRFWQAGGGYDRSLWSTEEINKTIKYIHENPVKAGITKNEFEYAWSSAKCWQEDSELPIKINPDSFKV